MARVDAKSDIDIGELNGVLPHQGQFFEPATERRPGSGRIFEQDGEVANVEAARCLGERTNHAYYALLNGYYALLNGVSLAISWMRHQILGADGYRPL